MQAVVCTSCEPSVVFVSRSVWIYAVQILFFFKNQVNQECLLRCSGYGDLWDDIQNVPETDRGGSAHGISGSSKEAEGSKENSEVESKESSLYWRSEEEENWDKEDNTDNDNKDEDDKGTVCRLAFAVSVPWSPKLKLSHR